jgi:hypothetical protein
MTDLNASLILKTSDLTSASDYSISSAYSSAKGSCNEKLSTITWNNINLRTILGDMYDKYDCFNLCLNTISTAQANAIDPALDCRNVIVKLYGLPWKNQTYSVASGSNSSGTVITTFNFVANGSTTQYYYSNNIATFTKNQDLVNITVEYSKILDGITPNTNLTYTPSITGLTGTGSLGSSILTLSSANSNLSVGTLVTASGIPLSTYITAISGTTVTLSKAITTALSGTTLAFTVYQTYPNVCIIFDIFGIKNDDGSKNATRI